jgi:hypothetical protein
MVRPAGEEVIVSLQLCRAKALGQPVVELDEQLASPLREKRRIRPDALKSLNFSPLVLLDCAHEFVWSATTWKT